MNHLIMQKRPIIGLNMYFGKIDNLGNEGMSVPVHYIDAIAKAGGVPLCIPPYQDISMLEETISHMDGFLFIGGDDYLPDNYGGRPQPQEELVSERRDRFDVQLARWILLNTNLPALGICGGQQLIAIALGGALIQDIATEWTAPCAAPPLAHAKRERSGEDILCFCHALRLKEGSLVASATGTAAGELLITNSTHHQAVHPERLGKYLRATAFSADGIVESIEPAIGSAWHSEGRFLLGVQWHPERMQDEECQRNIFRALVEAAAV
jgi:putative glutamine amidotransferase